MVLNTSRGDSIDDPGYAQPADLEWVRTTAQEAGVEFSVRQEVRGREPPKRWSTCCTKWTPACA